MKGARKKKEKQEYHDYSREDGSAAKVSALGNKRRNRQEACSEKEAQQLRIEQKRWRWYPLPR